MTKRSKRMEPVKELVALREKNAARHLAECRRVLLEREMRLVDLTAYRDSYIAQQENVGNVDPVRFQEYRLFLGKLNHAINEQQRLVNDAKADFDAVHNQWSDSMTHSKAIEKTVDRFKQAEREDENRREQKEDDEVASRHYS